ncbi:Hep-Hag [compost metagenome]
MSKIKINTGTIANPVWVIVDPSAGTGDLSHIEGSDTFAGTFSAHAEGQYTLSLSSDVTGVITSINAGNKQITIDTNSALLSTIQAGDTIYIKLNGGTVVSDTIVSISNKVITLTNLTPTATWLYAMKVSGTYGAQYPTHAEGYNTVATGNGSHAEGFGTLATDFGSHSEGFYTQSLGMGSHAEGNYSISSGGNSHAEGNRTKALNNNSHAEGDQTISSGISSHAEGTLTTASALNAHSEGNNSVASGANSHAEGDLSIASGVSSHAEGQGTISGGTNSHAEGMFTYGYAVGSHVENGSSFTGYALPALSSSAGVITFSTNHAYLVGDTVGRLSQSYDGTSYNATTATTATITATTSTTITISPVLSYAVGELVLLFKLANTGKYSHVEGIGNISTAYYGHAEGNFSKVTGTAAHAEGQNSIASALSAHAEGYWTVASGQYSHSEGNNTSTAGFAGAHIMGQYGDSPAAYSWALANGTNVSAKGLAAKILQNGTVTADGAYSSAGADYAELFEWIDGNLDNEDRVGFFVTLDGDKIKKASSLDSYILGVVSANPSVIGDDGGLRWQNKYITDEWGRIRHHLVTIPAEKIIEIIDGEEVEFELSKESYQWQPIINPEWNHNEPYVERIIRPEWDAIGMMGKLLVRDDGTCEINGFCSSNNNGIATNSTEGYRVIKRISENIVQILIK